MIWKTFITWWKSYGTVPLSSLDEKLLTEKNDILNWWVKYFSNILNRPSTIHEDSIDAIEQRPIIEYLAESPRKEEVCNAMNCLQTCKAAGEDGLPAKIFKYDGQALLSRLHDLFLLMW